MKTTFIARTTFMASYALRRKSVKTPSDVLRQAAKLVRKQWIKHTPWNGLEGSRARFCAIGAIAACSSDIDVNLYPEKAFANPDPQLYFQAETAFSQHALGGNHTASWNDLVAANAEEVAEKMECVANALDDGLVKLET